MSPSSYILMQLSTEAVMNIRIAGMFIVLVGGLITGHSVATKLTLPDLWARRIMTFVLISFDWIIVLLVIWRMDLTRQLFWVPVVGVVLMLTIVGLSAVIFSFFKLQRKSFLSIILTAGLSNLGFTGGAFIAYIFLGIPALAIANIYLVLWLPVVFFIFFPLLKLNELRIVDSNAKLDIRTFLDIRFIILPAMAAALYLNLTNVQFPQFVNKLRIIDILVYVASALAFFAIGLQVNLSRLKNYTRLYFPLSAVKFILTPVVALLLLWTLALMGCELTDLMKKVILIMALTPTAIFAVAMSNIFDLDGPLASAIWLVTHGIFIILIIPLLFFILT